MIRNLAVGHPGYNQTLEVLSLLRLYPQTVALAGIAWDLGVKGQGPVKMSLAVLDHWGYELYRGMGDTRYGREHVAAVLPQSWQRAQVAAENYLNVMYRRNGVPRKRKVVL